jgi:acetyl esterase/lipase
MTDLIQSPGMAVSLTERKWSVSPMPLDAGRMKAAASVAAAALLSACSPLTAFNTFTPKDASTRVAVDLPYADGARHKLDVYLPRGKVEKAPVMVFFYGGGWDSGRKADYSFAGRALAAKGFVTVVPDYRLYPEVRYPDFLNDGALAVRWAVEHAAEYGGDPKRIVLSGHSAGAYNAVMLALDSKFLTDAGVDPKVITAAAGLSGPYDFLPLDTSYTRQSFGGYGDLAATQPINHVRSDAPPIFLAYGLSDTLVGRQNIDHLEKALEAKGAPVEVKLYPKLDHPGTVLALSMPFRGRSNLLADMTDFLKAHD